MLVATLRPLLSPSLRKVRQLSRHSIKRTAMTSHGGEPAGLKYPEPLRLQSLKEHKSTLIMLHGLGDDTLVLVAKLFARRAEARASGLATALNANAGAGDTGMGWADIGPLLQPDLPHTQFVFPTAPVRSITLNQGMMMTGWFDIADLNRLGTEQDEAAMLESKRYIEGLVQQQVDAGIPSSSIVVGGFSQGGAMALLMLRSKFKLAGVIGLSCYLPLHEQMPVVSEENKDTPVLMCHGDCDQVVHYRYGLTSYELLNSVGCKVEFQAYEFMGHEACPEELQSMRDFLQTCFAADGSNKE